MSTTLPPGEYYIGDPCYVFGEDWNDGRALFFTGKTDEKLDNAKGMCDVILDGGDTYRGHKFFAHFTAHGDGSFVGSNGFDFGVDAGLLGAIPLELVTKKEGLTCGVIVSAPRGLTCSEDNGSFYFEVAGGESIIIETDYQEDDEENDF